MPFEMMAYFEDLPSGAKLVGMLVVGSAILAFLTGHRVRMLSLPMVMRVVLVLFSAMSLAWSLAREDTLSNMPRIAQLLIFVLLIWEFAVTYKDQVWILRSLLVGMLVPLSMAFAAFSRSLAHSRPKAESVSRGGGHDLNYLAYMCSVSILIAVYLATNSLPLDRYCRWFYWGMAVLCALEPFSPVPAAGLSACWPPASLRWSWPAYPAAASSRSCRSWPWSLFVYVLVRYLVPAALLNRVTWGAVACG